MDSTFKLHHIGIAVADMQRAIRDYEQLFAYRLISGPFDDPIQHVSVSFLSRGEDDTLMELVAPLGEKSPVTGLLKRGGGTYHVCYEVPVIETAIDHMTANGAFQISQPVPAVAFAQRRIAWLRTSTGLLVELVEAYLV